MQAAYDEALAYVKTMVFGQPSEYQLTQTKLVDGGDFKGHANTVIRLPR